MHLFSGKWQSFMPNLYNCYLLALKEYTIDSRGDIGAWVREAATIGLHVRRFVCYGERYENCFLVGVRASPKCLRNSHTTVADIFPRDKGKENQLDQIFQT